MKKKMIIKNEVVEWTFEQVLEYFDSSIHKEINRQKSVFDRPTEEREDMYQNASIQLYNAFLNHDEDNNHHFSTYAMQYIRKGVQYDTVKNNAEKRDGGISISMDQNLGDDEEFSLNNVLSEEFDFDSPMMAREIMTESIKVMTDLEVEYLFLMLNDYTQTEVADKKGITRMATNQNFKKVKNKVKEVATKYGY